MDELRRKSPGDLQTLWHVLLREKNMLETERGLYRAEGFQLPNPSRVRKVKTSMARLQTVLTERRKLGLEAHRAWVDLHRSGKRGLPSPADVKRARKVLGPVPASAGDQ